MPKQQNLDTVSELKTKVDKSKAIYLADYRGLTHKQLEELHKNVKKVDAELIIVKNSLLKMSLGKKGDTASAYQGPTAVLFSYADEIAPLKEVFKFIKTYSLPKMKLGLLGANVYDEIQVTTLAKLPTKDVLQGQVVGTLAGPMYGLVYALNGNIQKLVYVLSKIQK